MATTSKVVLVLEYEGTNYCGFQWQANLPTIQGEVEHALYQLTGERNRVMGASRTDAGVHARGQVVSTRSGSYLPPQTFISGLNHYLPKDIAVRSAYRVRDAFDVRRHALNREYKYFILNSPTRSPLRESYCYLIRSRLDTEAMNQACQALIGEHDFASFISSNTAEIKNTVRRVDRAEIENNDELTVFNMVANSFLTHQVRNTIGTLIRVGLKKMSIDEFCNIIEAKEPALAGPTAPAHGLCLTQINYPRPFEEEI
ncbi:tRNA pseudouridine(38-40) synthase TruA [Chloroflexota bacterium]